MPGTFIVLEGPDGSGTTTQSALLAEKLRAEGRDVLLTAEPTDQAIGKFIRQELAAKSIPSPAALQLLFCADRAAHVDMTIKPALAAGKTVICDRYSLSTVVYGQALGLDPRWLEQVNVPFVVPNLLLVALPGVETCLERIARRSQRDVLEGDKFQRTVYELYEQAAKTNPSAVVVDTGKPIPEVAEEIFHRAING